MRNDAFLDEALHIADRLAATAFHDGDRCNWITRAVPYRGQAMAEEPPQATTLNASVYSGTAGLALFLARAHHFSDDPAHRVTAMAALRHALDHASYVDAEDELGQIGGLWRHGFYLGTLGIAWVAEEVGAALGEPHFQQASRRLVEELQERKGELHEHDLVFGSASGIPALLDLERRGDPLAGALADHLGEALLAAAQREGNAWSWGGSAGGAVADEHGHGAHNLTGFSHGTSGIAYGLARLHAARGDGRFLDGAHRALQYERDHFDAEAGNWPHFGSRPGKDGRYPCSTSWCHGAPGIGVARTLLPPPLRDRNGDEEVRIARATTETHVRRQLDFPGTDWMACHGVAGNAECLWLLEEFLGREDALARQRALGAWGLERFGAGAGKAGGFPVEWPTGVAAGTYPPLLTGVAGIGHYFLRLHAPDRVPTILVPAQGMTYR